jgi:putative tryptophan/tyrosine transport system substrate-binding protein
MRRREFITLLGCAAAMPSATKAQGNVKRIAILGPAEEPRYSQVVGGLKRGLRDQGYADTTLDIIENKVARGDNSGATASVAQAMQQGVVVLFVIGSELARIARQVSTDLPIVFITPGDPVAAGLVASLARPGGNTTAMTFEFPELSAKRLELLKAVAPEARRVLVLYDPSDESPRQGLASAREAAPQLAMTLVERQTRHSADISRVLEALGEADAVLTIPGGATSAHYLEIIGAANTRSLPTFFHSRTGSTSEALASYGASDLDIAREAARLVDRILKGEKAGDLPVERPTKFEFVINLKTAKTIGLDISPMLIARADRVIE